MDTTIAPLDTVTSALLDDSDESALFAAVVSLGVVAGLIVICCLASGIKAIRDRSDIKKRRLISKEERTKRAIDDFEEHSPPDKDDHNGNLENGSNSLRSKSNGVTSGSINGVVAAAMVHQESEGKSNGQVDSARETAQNGVANGSAGTGDEERITPTEDGEEKGEDNTAFNGGLRDDWNP
ncbi:hypothetical protein CAPTEDRAFT_226904 [Capitella teleta]|uniref:Transmembrane protein n=1 Tax=Capitella teleta TaxID=283909 RepID=R7TV10_CAPTE|nr:hypothetical protein CAPTEDRAFT_226904 [Capitella teleta]|eukprot:ELT94830.1 hypothetical protein CAPTEDRAFT_226904 [Capitella teleta]